MIEFSLPHALPTGGGHSYAGPPEDDPSELELASPLDEELSAAVVDVPLEVVAGAVVLDDELLSSPAAAVDSEPAESLASPGSAAHPTTSHPIIHRNRSIDCAVPDRARPIPSNFVGTVSGIKRRVSGTLPTRVVTPPKQEPERELYARLVRSHGADLFRFGYRLSGDAHVAEDLVQDTFSEAWRGRGTLRDRACVRAWLFQILRYRYAHLVRDSGRRPRIVGDEDEAEALSFESDPSTDIHHRDELQRALDQLADHFKLPFLMVFLQGLTCQEVADTLDLPVGTVLSRLHRARKALRIALSAPSLVGGRRG
jgi:RNA polymerase sigma-70 factor (ECF subfamily)